MNEKDWFRGAEWDKDSQGLFENKLKKTRGSYNKSQYLMIKASYLLDSGDDLNKSEGRRLMERVINEYPSEKSHVMFAYEQLGDYYFNQKKYGEAEFYYRQSVSFYRDNGRSGTSGIGDIKLAETIVKAKEPDKFSEVYRLLTDEFKKNDGSLSLNEDIFRYYSILAQLSNGLGKKDEAKRYAEKALQLSEIKEPQFDKYPKLGVVEVNNEHLIILRDILR